LFELSTNGKEPLKLNNDVTRTWLKDNDTVKFVGFAKGDGFTLGFGECVGTLLPSKK
jgi:fumarylacetoacetase